MSRIEHTAAKHLTLESEATRRPSRARLRAVISASENNAHDEPAVRHSIRSIVSTTWLRTVRTTPSVQDGLTLGTG